MEKNTQTSDEFKKNYCILRVYYYNQYYYQFAGNKMIEII